MAQSTLRQLWGASLRMADGTGAFWVAKVLTCKIPRILMYHRFGETDTARKVGRHTFDAQIRFLTEHFHPISLKDLCVCLASGAPVPPDSIAVTIDDAYEDVYTHAFPTLKRYSCPATIYVPTDFVDGKMWLWPDLIEYVIFRTKRDEHSATLGSKQYASPLQTEEQRRQAWRTIAGYCMGLGDQERSSVVEELASDLGVRIPSVPTSEYRALTWRQLQEMKVHGVDIGSHSCTHARLVSIDKVKALREIQGSKARIEYMIDGSVHAFAYPFGNENDYDDAIKRLVRETGYENAAVSYFDSRMTSDLFALRRSPISADPHEFRKVVFGIQIISSSLRRDLRR
jgi:peptidoglycan/xylan/chitin deacetylase (PgdA/CDA1 family)